RRRVRRLQRHLAAGDRHLPALSRPRPALPLHPLLAPVSRRAARLTHSALRFRDRDRHSLFILYWLGFGASSIEYDHAPRHSGQSSYSLRTLLRHAFHGLVFQTTALLRWIVYFGFCVSLAGALLAAYLLFVSF